MQFKVKIKEIKVKEASEERNLHYNFSFRDEKRRDKYFQIEFYLEFYVVYCECVFNAGDCALGDNWYFSSVIKGCQCAFWQEKFQGYISLPYRHVILYLEDESSWM